MKTRSESKPAFFFWGEGRERGKCRIPGAGKGKRNCTKELGREGGKGPRKERNISLNSNTCKNSRTGTPIGILVNIG